MKELDRKIIESYKKSKILKEICLGDNLPYDRNIEIRKQQDNEYKKMMFFKNLKKELEK